LSQNTWHSALIAAALVLTQHAAHAQESMPDMLRRIAPSVVQIKADKEAVGTGFVYPTPRHVTTSFTVANHDAELTVVLANGNSATAKVVAWSEPDDIAILELPGVVSATPLQLEPATGYAGQDVVLLGHPKYSRPELVDEPVHRDIPTPRFGHVALVSTRQVNIDIDTWSGDEGAPIFTTSGRVLGVASGRWDRELAVLDAASATRIDTLRRQIGKQGAFDPHPAASKGVFSGVYVSPWQAYHQVGAGILTGYRYRWFAASLANTFSHASFTPLDAETMRARWQVAYELYATADWSYTKQRKLCLGAGLALTATIFDVKRNGRTVDLPPKNASDGSLEPLLILQDIEGPVLFGIAYAPFAQAARLDIGFVIGRQ
jgi:hypothetical protein